MALALVAFALVNTAGADQARTPAPKDAKVYFLAPLDGETTSSPVTVKFGLEGMGIAPAGMVFESSGHHHLLIDAPLPALDATIPADQHHVHFGKGQTETTIELPPGKHTLQLLLGDHLHIPHSPPVVSEKITITVN